MDMDARMYMSINWDYHVSFVYRTYDNLNKIDGDQKQFKNLLLDYL